VIVIGVIGTKVVASTSAVAATTATTTAAASSSAPMPQSFVNTESKSMQQLGTQQRAVDSTTTNRETIEVPENDGNYYFEGEDGFYYCYNGEEYFFFSEEIGQWLPVNAVAGV
jgi:hypothetical protein